MKKLCTVLFASLVFSLSAMQQGNDNNNGNNSTPNDTGITWYDLLNSSIDDYNNPEENTTK